MFCLAPGQLDLSARGCISGVIQPDPYHWLHQLGVGSASYLGSSKLSSGLSQGLDQGHDQEWLQARKSEAAPLQTHGVEGGYADLDCCLNTYAILQSLQTSSSSA